MCSGSRRGCSARDGGNVSDGGYFGEYDGGLRVMYALNAVKCWF